jgi:histidyl-tRNA synthetase
MDPESLVYANNISRELRNAGISNEVYPGAVKIKKQLDYANAKGFEYAAIIGQTELENGTVALKNLFTGTQEIVESNQISIKLNHE